MTTTTSHVGLTSHPGSIFKEALPIRWGAADPALRGPIVATLTNRSHRNAIGTHSGSYSVYRALATAAGDLTPEHRPDLTNTNPVVDIGPFDSWKDPSKIVSIDPWGASVATVFRDHLQGGYDIRPTIAVTKAHMLMPELTEAIERGRLKIDGKIIRAQGDIAVTKAALDPVWYLPGIAERFGVDEGELRRVLFEETGGMFPELITRQDLKVLLPPIGSTTVYMFGDPRFISDPSKKLTLRVHDECNGSDVFGSDICTCRPYLCHGIEEAVRSAQEGGAGCIVYYRGYQVPRLQRAEAPGGRGQRRHLLPPDGVRGRRPGHALPGAHARRPPLAGYHQDRPPHLHERHEARRHRGFRHPRD